MDEWLNGQSDRSMVKLTNKWLNGRMDGFVGLVVRWIWMVKMDIRS